MTSSFIPVQRPPPTLEGLPTELWTQICNAKTSYANGELFIIDSASLSDIRLTSRALWNKTKYTFLQRHLACPKFSLTPWSLGILRDLSENEHLRTYVKELEFGPDCLNTELDEDLRYCKDLWDVSPIGIKHPYGLKESAWPIWPVVFKESSDYLTDQIPLIVRWLFPHGYSTWAEKYGNTFRQVRDEQRDFQNNMKAVVLLNKALKKFPNLKNIRIDTRPVGPGFTEIFGTYIRPSQGTANIGRLIGAHKMNLIPDPAPSLPDRQSKFNLDGLIFTQPAADLRLIQTAFMALSSSDSKNFTVELVITAIKEEAMDRSVFDSDCEHWTLLAPRLRSITFDLAGNDLGVLETPNFLSRCTSILKQADAVEGLYGRNISTSYDPPGIMSVLLTGTSKWHNLKYFRLFMSNERGSELHKFLLHHSPTLEEVSISHVTIHLNDGVSWESIIEALKGMPCLLRVTLEHLCFENQKGLKDVYLPFQRDMSRSSTWLKADGHENVCQMMEVASQHIFLGHKFITTFIESETRLVHFYIPEGFKSASEYDIGSSN
ncbi:Nn.00g005690.m01.CDS01 [Neocucurbitaria sp. VM-36]